MNLREYTTEWRICVGSYNATRTHFKLNSQKNRKKL